MTDRFDVMVLDTVPAAHESTAGIANLIKSALNSEAHKAHGLEAVVSLTNGMTVVVWRVA